MEKQVFSGQTADGQSDSYNHQGGKLFALVSGSFGGGTASLEVRYGDTWYSLGLTLTDSGYISEDLPSAQYRIDLTGATTPNLDAFMGSAEP